MSRNHAFRNFCAGWILLLPAAGLLQAQDAKAEASARKAMDEFMTAFNSRDSQAWAATLNYPHVRFASNQVRSYASAAEFGRDSVDYAQRLAPWDHSRWESMQVIQSGPDKVHFAVIFIRYDASNKEIGRFPSLYIVTLKDGHWGVQARSSFAP
ncbi:MAG TPA: hypothetical protein VKG79_09875 [Bryobacteraceae bacterium]|nr:hypothetical protein [Bryobacteraceae bacterium]